MYKGNRTIRNNNVFDIYSNTSNQDSTTLESFENNMNYLSNFYLQKNKYQDPIEYDAFEKKNMLIPNILITYKDYLKYFNIQNITEFINENIDNYSFNTLNRILNCWIRDNLFELKGNNNILDNIYIILFTKYKYELLNINNIETIIRDHIETWVQKKYYNSFFFDLGTDLEIKLNNKLNYI